MKYSLASESEACSHNAVGGTTEGRRGDGLSDSRISPTWVTLRIRENSQTSPRRFQVSVSGSEMRFILRKERYSSGLKYRQDWGTTKSGNFFRNMAKSGGLVFPNGRDTEHEGYRTTCVIRVKGLPVNMRKGRYLTPDNFGGAGPDPVYRKPASKAEVDVQIPPADQ